MKKNTQYPVIEVPSSGISNWSRGARTLAFLYSKKGNFVIKGYIKEVEEYIKQNFTHYYVNYSLWHNGVNRDIWQFWKDCVTIYSPEPKSKSRTSINKNKWTFAKYSHQGYYPIVEFKRLPKRWVQELEVF